MFLDPGVQEDIGDVIPLLNIFAEHVPQKIDANFANLGPPSSFKAQVLSQYFLLHLLASCACERHLATEELVGHDTQAPNVASEIAGLFQDHLRCLVSECTWILPEALVIIKDNGQTKVSNFDLGILSCIVEEDILVLDIAVNDFLHMDIL